MAGSLDGGLAEKRRWVGGAASDLGATPTGSFGSGFHGWSARTSSHSFANLYSPSVPLQQVRKELELWKQPLLDEYKSLTEITGALKVTTEEELRRDPRYHQMEVAPAMLVPTIKSPHGRRRARIVICGNRIEAKNPDNQPEGDAPHSGPGGSLFANYAGGADGVLLRSMLRKTAAKRWRCATVDVRTAFLLAPRREAQSKLLTMRPPKVLQEAGIVGPDEWWEVENAMVSQTFGKF